MKCCFSPLSPPPSPVKSVFCILFNLTDCILLSFTHALFVIFVTLVLTTFFFHFLSFYLLFTCCYKKDGNCKSDCCCCFLPFSLCALYSLLRDVRILVILWGSLKDDVMHTYENIPTMWDPSFTTFLLNLNS